MVANLSRRLMPTPRAEDKLRIWRELTAVGRPESESPEPDQDAAALAWLAASKPAGNA